MKKILAGSIIAFGAFLTLGHAEDIDRTKCAEFIETYSDGRYLPHTLTYDQETGRTTIESRDVSKLKRRKKSQMIEEELVLKEVLTAKLPDKKNLKVVSHRQGYPTERIEIRGVNKKGRAWERIFFFGQKNGQCVIEKIQETDHDDNTVRLPFCKKAQDFFKKHPDAMSCIKSVPKLSNEMEKMLTEGGYKKTKGKKNSSLYAKPLFRGHSILEKCKGWLTPFLGDESIWETHKSEAKSSPGSGGNVISQ
ncbi:MAG: hypothetical protein OXB88_05995 [Bacteriovoracales bacterium]|nr:hypothetical protein [Bacteriovoracales bacterium]